MRGSLCSHDQYSHHNYWKYSVIFGRINYLDSGSTERPMIVSLNAGLLSASLNSGKPIVRRNSYPLSVRLNTCSLTVSLNSGLLSFRLTSGVVWIHVYGALVWIGPLNIRLNLSRTIFVKLTQSNKKPNENVFLKSLIGANSSCAVGETRGRNKR